MAGVWPNLDAADLETRVRTYLNEVTADFFTQADIWRWLSIAQKDIAQKTLCVRRILDVVTVNATRNVATNAYKVLFVEYVPATGRTKMLSKIDPKRAGQGPYNGTVPQYWFEFGANIGIDPIPDGSYSLRLYVADLPKMQYATFPLTAWNALWTASGTGTWSHGAGSDAYTGTTGQAGVDTVTTPILTTATNYTFTITLSGISNCGLVVTAGTVASPTMNTPGVHSFTAVTASTALTLTATMTGATGGLTVDDLYILKEVDFASVGDQTELPTMWQHLLALYATYQGLIRDKKNGPAKMLENMYSNEIAYLRQNVIEIIPDGRNDQKPS
jgi:hypothetical protein